MRVWTAHEKPHAPPLLMREGFSWGALLFGPIWLGCNRAWLAAGATLLLIVSILALAGPPASTVLLLGLAVLTGLFGRDLVRWSAAHRGYAETHVIAARTEDDARLRLMASRPDLVDREMVAEAAPR
jgi:hypothetical protein